MQQFREMDLVRRLVAQAFAQSAVELVVCICTRFSLTRACDCPSGCTPTGGCRYSRLRRAAKGGGAALILARGGFLRIRIP